MMSTTLPRSKTPSGAAYASFGAGEALVLIHGVGLRLEAWQPQIAVLAQTHRVIAVDLPGHGESMALPADAGLADFVGWGTQVLRELGLGPVNVAGHSMGALIAGGLAATAPELVRRVALLNGVYRRTDAARAAVMVRAAEIRTGHFDREAPLHRWFDAGHAFPAAEGLCRALLAKVDQQGYATAYAAFAAGDLLYADAWAQVQCSALFLTGDGDANSTAEMARAMTAAAPKGEAVVIEGHRHMVNLTAPEQVNAAFSHWLSGARA